MNRLLTIAISTVIGTGIGLVMSSGRASASSPTLYGTIKGEVSEGKIPLNFEFRDPETDKLIGTETAMATVRNGKYTADLASTYPSGLYCVKVTGPNAEPLVDTFVQLQASTPGIKETGNINIDGTLLAGKIGVPTTNANAMINGQGTAGVAGLRGQSGTIGTLGVATDAGGIGVHGIASATTGTSAGVRGTNSSAAGVGVRGIGSGAGVRGETTSIDRAAVEGAGVKIGGSFTANLGSSFGVLATATGTKSIGVQGEGEVGLSGVGNIGVLGLGTLIGGKFESTSNGNPAILAKTFTIEGIGLQAIAGGGLSVGVQAEGDAKGGSFTSNASASTGVLGSSRGTGVSFGGDFITLSTEGRGVRGTASAVSGATFGGYFSSASASGTGMKALATSATGSTIAGDFQVTSNSGIGIRARATSTTGNTTAGQFTNSSSSGSAIVAISSGATGGPIAVQGIAAAPSATGGFFNVSSSTGNTSGVRSQVASKQGKAVLAQNFGTGANIELGSPNGSVFLSTGDVTRQSGQEIFPITPIAYGTIGSAGTKLGGTNNFSVSQSQASKAYFIHLTNNEQLSEFDMSIQIQQFGNIGSQRGFAIVDFDTQDPTTFTVHFKNAAGNDISASFMFTVLSKYTPPSTPSKP